MTGSRAAQHLHVILGHHVWSTLALLDHCRQLSAPELELTTPGGFGSVQATLEHLVRSDRSYQRRILGEPAASERDREAPLDVLRAEMERQGRAWLDVLARLEELDVELPAYPDDDPPYPSIDHAVSLLLVQAVHHGNEHRAHVCSILGAHGLDVPDVSGWEYVRLERVGGPSALPEGWN